MYQVVDFISGNSVPKRKKRAKKPAGGHEIMVS